MSSKMCTCKACGQPIAKSAKTCPHCGAKNKKKHPILVILLILVVLIVIIASVGSNDEAILVEDSTTVQTDAGSSTVVEQTTKTAKDTFAVGEIAELNQITVSMTNITESAGSAYNKPTDGNVFVICEFEIANDSKQEISVSSMMSFEAYCDDYACNYSLSALIEKGNENQLDGTVAPGKKLNGVIGYEVPSDWNELEVRFTPNFWDGKDIIFIATNN